MITKNEASIHQHSIGKGTTSVLHQLFRFHPLTRPASPKTCPALDSVAPVAGLRSWPGAGGRRQTWRRTRTTDRCGPRLGLDLTPRPNTTRASRPHGDLTSLASVHSPSKLG